MELSPYQAAFSLQLWMVSKGRKRARELERRPPRIDPRPRILVVCEGTVTEPAYLYDLSHDLRAVVNVVVDEAGVGPKACVERAVKEKHKVRRAAKAAGDDGSLYADIWCVFDIDDHPQIPDARQQAAAHGIRLAISNPCFELWLLLHFQAQTAFLDRYSAQSICRGHMPGYVKKAPFDALKPLYDAAVSRATDLHARNERDEEPDKNPSTGVHVLTERIRTFGSEVLIQEVEKAK